MQVKAKRLIFALGKFEFCIIKTHTYPGREVRVVTEKSKVGVIVGVRTINNTPGGNHAAPGNPVEAGAFNLIPQGCAFA